MKRRCEEVSKRSKWSKEKERRQTWISVCQPARKQALLLTLLHCNQTNQMVSAESLLLDLSQFTPTTNYTKAQFPGKYPSSHSQLHLFFFLVLSLNIPPSHYTATPHRIK